MAIPKMDRQYHRGPANGNPQQRGLLGAVENTVSNPLNFEGLPGVREQSIVQPSSQPVDVPGPVGFRGPSSLGYQGNQINPGQTYQAPGDVDRIGGGQYFNAPNRDFAGQGDSLEQATFQRGLNRIDPYMQEQRSAMAQRLQNQGLPVGSEAYDQELNRFDRSRSDQLENLALSSVGAGRAEQGRLFGQDYASGQFNAGEAQRRFANLMGSQGQQHAINLRNQQFNSGESARNFGERMGSEGQYFGQQMAGDQFAAGQGQARSNFDAQQQQQGFQNRMANQQMAGQNDQFLAAQQANQFREDMARRGLGTQERMTERQQPLNELSQILGMAGQVGQPGFQQTAQYSPMGVDYMGGVQNQYNSQLQAHQQNRSGLAGLLGGLGSAGIGMLPF